MADHKPQDRISRASARALAHEIADDLFVNHTGEQADRLVLWVDATERNLGGWCKRAVIDRIAKTLFEHAHGPEPPAILVGPLDG